MIIKYLLSQRNVDDPAIYNDQEFPPVSKRITCQDGFSLSVQASFGAYCCPRTNVAEWSQVEVGFPSAIPELIMPYAEESDNPTKTVYGYVPVELVEQLIEIHGGTDFGDDKEWLERLSAYNPGAQQ